MAIGENNGIGRNFTGWALRLRVRLTAKGEGEVLSS